MACATTPGIGFIQTTDSRYVAFVLGGGLGCIVHVTTEFDTKHYEARVDPADPGHFAFIDGATVAIAYIAGGSSFAVVAHGGITEPINYLSFQVKHSGSLFRLSRLLPLIQYGTNRRDRYDAFVDTNCGQHLSVRITHAGSLLRLSGIKLIGNERKAQD